MTASGSVGDKSVKQFLIVIAIVLCVSAQPLIIRAQEKQGPAHKMTEFHMALLKRGPKWSPQGMSGEVRKGHLNHVFSLLDSGRA